MKQNAMLAALDAKYKAKYRAKFDRNMETLTQLCCDAAFFAAHEVLQLGAGRAPKFREALERELHWIASMMEEDQKDDPDFEYAKAKIDERMQPICGEHFQPWGERYG